MSGCVFLLDRGAPYPPNCALIGSVIMLVLHEQKSLCKLDLKLNRVVAVPAMLHGISTVARLSC